MLRYSPACLLALLCWSVAVKADTRAAVDFERDIARILVLHCAGCHNASDPKGGLDLTTRATAVAGGAGQTPAIVPNDAVNSNLISRIRAGEMPPEGKAKPVSPEDLGRLEAWIKAGAIWPQDRVLSSLELTTDARAGRDWWSLQTPQKPALPTVRHADLVRSPIDAFVLARLEAEGIEPAGEADRAAWIRRATFDLLGIAPTRQEIEAFVHDTAADAYEKVVDRLLASPQFGERWGRHWLDVVRFAESNGYETNTARANAWPYRDWVIRALNDDLPYPEFVFAQLAGDQQAVDAATGYLVGGAHDIVGSPDMELTRQQRLNDLDDMVSTTSTAFLGLSAGCAKCHDHKFDPISQRDYYALQATFSGVQHGEREVRTPESEATSRPLPDLRNRMTEIEGRIQAALIDHQPLAQPEGLSAVPRRPAVNPRLNVDRFASVSARYVRFTVLATDGSEPCLDELEIFAAGNPPRNLALVSLGARATASSVFAEGGSALHRIEHINDGRFGNGRSWISAETGAGWVQIQLAEPATIDRVVWARDREGAFSDRLATRYKIEVSQDGDTWQTVADGDDRKKFDGKTPSPDPMSADSLPLEIAAEVRGLRSEADGLRAKIEQLLPQKVYAGNFTEPQPTFLLYRGEPMQQRERMAPGTIAAVGRKLSLNSESTDAERRAALARWIGDSSNPLTARVMVNRIWHYHFGQGLVKTPSDFGFNGGAASHPELLDWLAVEFIARGWRPKAVHREIMLSNTYRQSSALNAAAAAKDASGRLLWRFPPRRLEAEPIRDAILRASGSLDLRMGGPGYDAFEPNTNYVKVYLPKQAFGPAEWRRMVYQNKPRMRQDGIFGEFDCPDSSQTTARRNISTTALQALNLMNGALIIEQAELFARRLEREAGNDGESQVRQGFWLAFGREPDEDELSSARQLVATEGLPIFCRALFNANEFLYLN